MNLKDNFYYANLYAYYKELLTQKQSQYLSMYYEEDFSIVEIAQHFQVSKESVFDLIKRVNKKLEVYEQNLNLHKKSLEIEKILKINKVNENIINQIMEKL